MSQNIYLDLQVFDNVFLIVTSESVETFEEKRYWGPSFLNSNIDDAPALISTKKDLSTATVTAK